MKPRTTLILLGVFLALGVYVYFGEIRRPESTATGTPTPPPLWTVAADQVVGLTVQGGGKETRLTRPAGGEWQMEAPQAVAADGERVTRSLDQMITLTATRSFTDTAGSLADYGLEKPALEVTLRLADGSTRALKIGVANPQQTGYYAQVQGQGGVHLLPDTLVTDLRDLLDSPPIKPTPTPTGTPTATPAATTLPAATAAPAAAATPAG